MKGKGPIKKNVVFRSKTIIGLIDSSKWGKVSFGTFVQTEQLDIIITDEKAPEEIEKKLKEKNITILKI